LGGHHQSAPVAQAVTPDYTGLQLQTSSNALPIPIVWGVTQIAPNLIWSGDFNAQPTYTQETGTNTGKGGASTSTYSYEQVTGYNYFTAIIFGLCEGPIHGIGTIWQGQSTYDTSSLGLSEFDGGTPQSTWSYLSSNHPDQALSYPGLAFLASSNFALGSSASLNLTYVEVAGILGSSSGVNGLDADPAQVIQDFLTNAQYGVGFPSASIDANTLFTGASCYQVYCRAAGLALSPALVNQEAANSILSRWLQLTNTAAIWSGGRLKFIPYGDSAIGAFMPNLTPVYDLTDDDFIFTDGEDPVQVGRIDPYAAYNMQALEILDSGNSWAATPIIAFDQNAIDLYGLRIASTLTAHEICDTGVGMNAAQLILQRGLYIRTAYTFKLSWEYCLLEPMDLVNITDTALGLANTTVRITEIDEDDNGILMIVAEEFPAGTATAVAYPSQASSGILINRNIAPASVNTPSIYEPPSALSASGKAEVWIGVSGGTSGVADPNWGGAFVWISTDNITFSQIGAITAPARQGLLTATLASSGGQANPQPPFNTIDTAHTLSVSLTESGGALESTTSQGVENAATLCLIDQELMAYETVALTGSHAYNLTNLARGVYGSIPASHMSGAVFTRLDAAIFKYIMPDSYLGQEIYIKLQSFNVFGNAVQDLAACTVYTYKPFGLGAFGPIATALATGNNVDCGLASGGAAQYDDFGFASDPYPNFIDLGLASS
jgi:hypothetical protein